VCTDYKTGKDARRTIEGQCPAFAYSDANLLGELLVACQSGQLNVDLVGAGALGG
jgi:hypothetical protein